MSVTSVMFNSLQPNGLKHARLLCLWNSPGKNTGVGCHFFLQRIFPNPDTKPRSPTLQADSLPSEPPGKSVINSAFTLYFFFNFKIHVFFKNWFDDNYKQFFTNCLLPLRIKFGQWNKSCMLLTETYELDFQCSKTCFPNAHLWALSLGQISIK